MSLSVWSVCELSSARIDRRICQYGHLLAWPFGFKVQIFDRVLKIKPGQEGALWAIVVLDPVFELRDVEVKHKVH